MLLKKIFTAILLMAFSFSAFSHGDKKEEQSPLMVNTDTEVGKVVAQFHAALQNSDVETIKTILAEDVLIFEGSGAERSLEEYASHHMKSDMKFLASIDSKLIERNIMINGDIAISSSRSKLTGSFKGKELNKVSIETLVLKKVRSAWKVIRVHWS
ncbi:YybH family protein [Kangiella sediminilitoris]|uniref:DUF4440 domain-containing protein n=1 Tax=Kangiella sediminilitoris TaxID=1144748 RepID=A0A1B3BAR0_9GAMM|nr:nuclear transport factor 2 family protein [Kangiella sediminilitoris]AOE49854.1 hypothetical protein KS2013_1134 [Kangiella sediminilitoris]